MNFHALLHTLLLLISINNVYSAPTASSTPIRALFLFKDVLKSNTTSIKTSGFNTLVIFGVGYLADGGIMYYSNTPGSVDTLIATNGTYVGGSALADKVKSFKDGSGIDRIEISTNAQHIRDLMANPGAGADTKFYRNLVALQTAWGLDGVNNDDESIYDLSSTVAFGKMLGNIGLKYSISPYTSQSFWANLVKQVGTTQLDRTYLQCYDGGAGNNPSSWSSALGMKVVPLVWVTNDSKPDQSTSVSQAKSKFTSWNKGGALAGGGYWNDFDIEKLKSSYKDYGAVLTSVFV